MVRKLYNTESNKLNRNRRKVESANDIVNNLVSLTKGMWFEPMNKFKSVVYNADEIIPKIDFDSCVEFGTNNGQELIIYDKQDGRKHIRYSCSMTTMFDKLVITDVWDKSGCVYECDWDVIYDELAKKNSYKINERLYNDDNMLSAQSKYQLKKLNKAISDINEVKINKVGLYDIRNALETIINSLEEGTFEDLCTYVNADKIDAFVTEFGSIMSNINNILDTTKRINEDISSLNDVAQTIETFYR